MSLLWITNPTTGGRRSEPRPGFPKGKYRILPGSQANRYILTTGEPPSPLMIGKLEECKDCAAACELEPLVLQYFPELNDLTGLSDNAAGLVALVRRTAASGQRLGKILRHSVPSEVLELELSILRKVVGALAIEANRTSPQVLR